MSGCLDIVSSSAVQKLNRGVQFCETNGRIVRSFELRKATVEWSRKSEQLRMSLLVTPFSLCFASEETKPDSLHIILHDCTTDMW